MFASPLIRNILIFLGSLVLVMAVVLLFNHLRPTWSQAWSQGMDWGGDLKQHYVAGKVLNECGYEKLYRGFHFGCVIFDVFHSSSNKFQQSDFNYRYGPFFAWISRQLLLVPYNIWMNGWFIASMLCYFTAFWLMRKYIFENNFPSNLAVLYFFAFLPFLYNLSIFQNSTLSLLILVATAVMLRKKREFMAGLILSCSFYKPQIAPALAAFMFLAGYPRFVLGVFVGLIAWNVISLFICGWQAHLHYLHSLSEVLNGLQGDEMVTNIPWKGFILTVLPLDWNVSVRIAFYLFAFLTLFLVLFMIWRASKRGSWLPDYTLWIAVIFWLTFSPHVKPYEMVLGMGWWLILANFARHSISSLLLCILYWSIGVLAVAARFLDVSLSAPFLTIFLLSSLFIFIREKSKEKLGQEF